ncbi:hypothetical protein [Reichenbachiella sp.]
MEINEFGELNALNKLLSKVKFHEDLDFQEFKQFVESPIIASIYERIFDQYISECKKKGHLPPDYQAQFKFDSRDGRVLKRRIDELSESERTTLVENNSIEIYLKTLISPLTYEKNEFRLLKDYFLSKR